MILKAVVEVWVGITLAKEAILENDCSAAECLCDDTVDRTICHITVVKLRSEFKISVLWHIRRNTRTSCVDLSRIYEMIGPPRKINDIEHRWRRKGRNDITILFFVSDNKTATTSLFVYGCELYKQFKRLAGLFSSRIHYVPTAQES